MEPRGGWTVPPRYHRWGSPRYQRRGPLRYPRRCPPRYPPPRRPKCRPPPQHSSTRWTRPLAGGTRPLAGGTRPLAGGTRPLAGGTRPLAAPGRAAPSVPPHPETALVPSAPSPATATPPPLSAPGGPILSPRPAGVPILSAGAAGVPILVAVGGGWRVAAAAAMGSLIPAGPKGRYRGGGCEPGSRAVAPWLAGTGAGSSIIRPAAGARGMAEGGAGGGARLEAATSAQDKLLR
eukprot:scaffold2903_cov77-Isochrysis_galbana.AAC.3